MTSQSNQNIGEIGTFSIVILLLVLLLLLLLDDGPSSGTAAQDQGEKRVHTVLSSQSRWGRDGENFGVNGKGGTRTSGFRGRMRGPSVLDSMLDHSKGNPIVYINPGWHHCQHHDPPGREGVEPSGRENRVHQSKLASLPTSSPP